ncbi:hypothetical protein BS329_15160 [Amycolatopsis coloradensis]|uniref:Uncharacterized protein n=1 Tax=Amycolatopsis coloradensis TaxID=76021 RepID=A0A1R0KVF5_9PSEU|nr:hypothetical protein [Amycolatopsis coloradensis]OLZ52628.1 hypothetical protein BS329_15160 [Amycolatopsis coloradensis]
MTDRPSHNVRFFGGPLDGRVQELGDTEPIAGTVLKHVHLHDGPKIETRYELGLAEDDRWEFRLCSAPVPEPAPRPEPETDGVG